MKALTELGTRSHRLSIGLLAFAVSLLAYLSLHGAAAGAATCSNEAIREGQISEALPEGTVNLPDCMALEMVSPSKKFNQYAESPNFSADGERVMFVSLAALADTPKQSGFYDPYIATRGTAGWGTESTAIPPSLVWGSDTLGHPCSYSPDLSRWALWGSTAAQATVGITTPFHGALGGFFAPLGPTMVPITGDEPHSGSVIGIGAHCEGGSTDASHLLFSINESALPTDRGFSYLPGDPVPTPDSRNVYEAYLDEGVPTLVLMQRDRDGVAYGGSCGATVGSTNSSRGAVSPDASRVYLTTSPDQPENGQCEGKPKRIMERLETPSGPEISELISNECTRVSPPCSGNGSDTYLGASQEGGKVFFSTSRQLTNSDRDETNDLYLYEASSPAGERLTQVSAGDDTDLTPGEGAEFLGLADYSGDGSHAYFIAKDALTTAASQAGKSAEAGKPNLYLYERDSAHPSGRTVFIATLNPADLDVWSWSPGEENKAMAVPRLGADPEKQEVGGDGHILVFNSEEPLSADDSDDGHVDIYRYDATNGAVERVSKADAGGEDNGAFGTSLVRSGFLLRGPQSISFGRQVSEDGKTIVFRTEEALDPGDAGETTGAYVWREGSLAVLPPGAAGPTVSMSGREVAFTDALKLLPEDGDGSKDVYLVRAGGGFPPPVPPTACKGEACQGPPTARPGEQGVASSVSTAGNVKEAACRRGLSRKRGKCVKQQSKKRHRKHAKKANHEQGARK